MNKLNEISGIRGSWSTLESSRIFYIHPIINTTIQEYIVNPARILFWEKHPANVYFPVLHCYARENNSSCFKIEGDQTYPPELDSSLALRDAHTF